MNVDSADFDFEVWKKEYFKLLKLQYFELYPSKIKEYEDEDMYEALNQAFFAMYSLTNKDPKSKKRVIQLRNDLKKIHSKHQISGSKFENQFNDLILNIENEIIELESIYPTKAKTGRVELWPETKLKLLEALEWAKGNRNRAELVRLFITIEIKQYGESQNLDLTFAKNIIPLKSDNDGQWIRNLRNKLRTELHVKKNLLK